jgi:hypothetical protein
VTHSGPLKPGVHRLLPKAVIFEAAITKALPNRKALICSMSAVEHGGDNAAYEGFFDMLIQKATHHMKYPTLDSATANVIHYIK